MNALVTRLLVVLFTALYSFQLTAGSLLVNVQPEQIHKENAQDFYINETKASTPLYSDQADFGIKVLKDSEGSSVKRTTKPGALSDFYFVILEQEDRSEEQFVRCIPLLSFTRSDLIFPFHYFW